MTMHRIAFLAAAVAVLAGCQSTGSDMTKSRPGLYDGGRSVLYQVQKSGGSPEQAMSVAAAAYAAGDTDQALYLYLKAVELDPKHHDALVWVGRIHRERGNFDLAELALHEVLKEAPDNLDALSELGSLQIAQRHYAEAAETLGKALRADQQRQGRPLPEGELASLDSLQVDNASPLRIYNGLGVLADLRNDFERAGVYYRQALKIDPRSAMVANSLGYSNYLAGNWTEARRAYQQALGFDGSYKPAWRNYGLLLARMGHYEDALSAFEQVEARAQASNDVGYICLIEGKLEEAEQFFRTAIDQSPAHYEVAWQNLKRVQQIRRLRERGGDVGEQGVSAELLPAVAATGPMPQVSTVHLPSPLRVSTP
ncbi:Flp pilus assembly protein TadD, contains TPR repeats [Geopseudomonas guangdongensis]|uniref:Flp pilus assembly protein TadD, contains TPR repeats n=2 Tax=Geopseudomonas guangdongensis TaxID=1245526 RepID=A0A1H2GLA6_9GAMM|nr:Flp pilus assembly protein TadD, contains TPR repeats [Pseudomonas guangdongensis]